MKIRNMMRGLAALTLAAALLCACGGPGPKGLGTDASAPPAETNASTAPSGLPESRADETPQLEVIRSGFAPFACGPSGFFLSEYVQSDRQQNLMYYDFDTLEERYYCDVTGCTHDHEGCVSYDLGGGVFSFEYGGYLYVNYASWRGGSDSEDQSDWPSALVRYNMDGTDPQVMLECPPYDLQIQALYGDGEAFYFSRPEGFMRLDLETFALTQVAPYGDQATTEDGALMLETGGLYDNRVLFVKDYSEPGVREKAVLLGLDVHTGEETILHTYGAEGTRPVNFTPEGLAYYAEETTGAIRCLDIAAGEDTLVTNAYCDLAETKQWEWGEESGEKTSETFYLASMWTVQPLGDWLIVKIEQSAGDDYKPLTCAYNLKTGESREVTFSNYFNGGLHHMYIHSQTPYGLLVIEEYRPRSMPSIGTDGNPYTLETFQEVYGLIDLEDFVDSQPDFRTIQPVAYAGMA